MENPGNETTVLEKKPLGGKIEVAHLISEVSPRTSGLANAGKHHHGHKKKHRGS